MTDTIILFMAHYLSPGILTEFRSLHDSCSPEFSVVMLYDNSRKDFEPSLFTGESQYFLYDLNTLAASFPTMIGKNMIPGNGVYPVLQYAESRRTFSFLWRVEYDVRFSGDWKILFRHFVDNDSDLLGTTFYRYEFRPGWNWWKSVKSPDRELKKEELLRGFLPIFRLSHSSCNILTSAYRKGWTGHLEASVPTILQCNDCTIEDVGGDGEFVRPENRNRFYTNTPSAPGLAPGTFVCPPHPCQYSNVPNMLYHPVKET